MNTRYLFVLLVGILTATNAYAHKPSDSYLRINSQTEQLTIEWDIALKDLELVIGLDQDQNNQIDWNELKKRQAEIAAYALARLSIATRGEPLGLNLVDLLYTKHSDGGYAVLALKADQATGSAPITIEYGLLFDVDPTHRGLVLYSVGSATTTHILTPSSPMLTMAPGQTNIWSSFISYVREGVWHIWIGFDHILFLISLLLPATYRCYAKGWHPVESFQPTLRSALHIVTVFTIAHSITLWLAVMQYATPPSRFIEATIAISIIATALNNLRPTLPMHGWAIAFAFGLVHGFGFANVLLDLGTSQASLAISLLGFNVGVELGQLAIVCAFVPIAYTFRKAWLYQRAVFRGGSILIALVAAIWAVERVFGVEILGF